MTETTCKYRYMVSCIPAVPVPAVPAVPAVPVPAYMGCACDPSNHACAIHAPPQVDGAYDDWVEVLRLIYHSGGSLPSKTLIFTAHISIPVQ